MTAVPEPAQIGLNWDTLSVIAQTTAVLLSLPAATWLFWIHLRK